MQNVDFAAALSLPDPSLTGFTVLRTLTGPTQSRGKLTALIRNHLAQEVQAVYLETMPWLVQFDLHTTKLLVDNVPRSAWAFRSYLDRLTLTIIVEFHESSGDLISHISYIPPEAHGRPMLFETLLTLPPNSTLKLTMDVTKAFLRYTEHQPDAQRGWDLPPSVLMPVVPHTSHTRRQQGHVSQERIQRIYSPAVLVDLATPDFSMPYNVIIMSSTLIALIFGSIFNLLTRKFVFLKVGGPIDGAKP